MLFALKFAVTLAPLGPVFVLEFVRNVVLAWVFAGEEVAESKP